MLFAFAASILTSCSHDACEDEAQGWIREAPAAAIEFDLVRAEIVADSAFVDSFTVNGMLYLHPRDSVAYNAFRKTVLIEWFRSGHEWIDIRPGDTTYCYRSCRRGRSTANACVYSSSPRHAYNAVVVLVDSARLANGSLVHVTSCLGCGD